MKRRGKSISKMKKHKDNNMKKKKKTEATNIPALFMVIAVLVVLFIVIDYISGLPDEVSADRNNRIIDNNSVDVMKYYDCKGLHDFRETEGSILTLNDRDYFKNVDCILRNADENIYVAVFSMQYHPEYNYSPTEALLDNLIEANNAGIDVRVIADEVFTKAKTMDYLSSNGVDVRYDGKGNSMHAKMIVVDRKYVIIGSTNWAYHALTKNKEASMMIHSEKVAEEYADYFEDIWKDLAVYEVDTDEEEK